MIRGRVKIIKPLVIKDIGIGVALQNGAVHGSILLSFKVCGAELRK
jgi:hypothetical protein